MRRRDLALAAAALVYPVNPLRTPTPELLPIADVTTTLTTKSCVEGGPCETRALPDASGDFTSPPGTPAFAEASARHHAAKTLAFFEAFGVAVPPSLELFVEDPMFGARFEPAGPALRFGRGELVDFAYDADVVAHETTHAVLAAARASGWRLTQHGASNEPDAIDEAVADYFAAAITGDAIVGEYIGLESAVPVRSLDSVARCPEAITGHAHADALVVSTVLWKTRMMRGPGFDAELVRALAKDSSFGELGARLGLADALAPCVPVRDVTPEQTVSAAQISFVAPGTARFSGVALAPGVVQFRANVPDGAGVLSVRFGGNAFSSKVIAKVGEPIRWTPAHDGIELEPERGATHRAGIVLPADARVIYFTIANAGAIDGEYDFVGVSFAERAADPSPPPRDLGASGSGCAAAPGERDPWTVALAFLLVSAAFGGIRSRRPPRCS